MEAPELTHKEHKRELGRKENDMLAQSHRVKNQTANDLENRRDIQSKNMGIVEALLAGHRHDCGD
jgi:hypothetical protein